MHIIPQAVTTGSTTSCTSCRTLQMARQPVLLHNHMHVKDTDLLLQCIPHVIVVFAPICKFLPLVCGVRRISFTICYAMLPIISAACASHAVPTLTATCPCICSLLSCLVIIPAAHGWLRQACAIPRATLCVIGKHTANLPLDGPLVLDAPAKLS